MTKYTVEYFDVAKGSPSATVAAYGITLNSAASDLISSFRYARIGMDKAKKLIVVQPHNDDTLATVGVSVQTKGATSPFIRFNSKDFVRVVGLALGLSFEPSLRCMAYWDEDEGFLVIDLNKVLERGKPAKRPATK